MVEEKATLMRKLGKKQLTLQLAQPLEAVPPELAPWRLALKPCGHELEYTFESHDESGIAALLARLAALGIGYKDLNTHQSSLEDIFVGLISERA